MNRIEYYVVENESIGSIEQLGLAKISSFYFALVVPSERPIHVAKVGRGEEWRAEIAKEWTDRQQPWLLSPVTKQRQLPGIASSDHFWRSPKQIIRTKSNWFMTFKH